MLAKKNSKRRYGKKGRPAPGPPFDAVFLCNPNSPTGRVVSRANIRQLLQAVQQINAFLIVDEAFVDFCPSCSVLAQVAKSQTPDRDSEFHKVFCHARPSYWLPGRPS